ncbi:hypothetical protein C8R44DRAFT_930648 [Mycena epipterygia]|nr:hypothetical protein C8R44DRAFT_930648 [Mycena epipterygia]
MNWLTSIFTSTHGNPASEATSEPRDTADSAIVSQTPDGHLQSSSWSASGRSSPSIRGSSSDNPFTSAPSPDYTINQASSSSGPNPDEAQPASDDELLELLLRHLPPGGVTATRLFDLAIRYTHKYLDVDSNFAPLWRDVLRYLPANGPDATAAEFQIARDKMLYGLMRSLMHRADVDVRAPVFSIFASSSANDEEEDPDNDDRYQKVSHKLVATMAMPTSRDLPPTHSASIVPPSAPSPYPALLAPKPGYCPRPKLGAYEQGVLPPAASPQFQQVRGDDEKFALQMILPASYCPTDTEWVAARRKKEQQLPLAVLFIPTDTDIPSAIVETPPPRPLAITSPTNVADASPHREPEDPVARHVASTRIPLPEVSAALTALTERFAARGCPDLGPCNVEVREEAVLVSVERTPDNIEDNWGGGRQLGWGAEQAHAKARENDLRIVGLAIDKIEAKEWLRPGVPFALNAVFMPEVTGEDAAVLFVPDDPSIPGSESERNVCIPSEKERRVKFQRFIRREGALGPERLGRYKRKRVGDDAQDEGVNGERAPKRWCGMEGDDTITRHILLDTWDDNIWED